jgi:hypothetical protein
MNNSDEPQSIPDNQVVYAQNIDWTLGTLGGKRSGSTLVSTDGSVVSRIKPELVSSTTGGGSSISSLNLSVPAVTDDGTGTSFLFLIVKVQLKGGTVSSMTIGGNALSAHAISGGAGASGRVEVWQRTSPALAMGTLAITFSASVNASVVAEVWSRADLLTAATVTTGTSTAPSNAVVTSPVIMVHDAIGWNAGATATVGFGQAQTGNLSNGTSRLATSYEVGRKPNTVMDWTLSTSQDWVSVAFEMRGAPASNFSGFVYAVFLMRHTKTNNPSEDELWLVDNFGRIDRRVSGTWQFGVPTVSQYPGVFDLSGFDVNGVSLHGKFFLAGSSGLNGLMVWDGTQLRYAGFPHPPAAPVVTDSASGGSYDTTRYFRVRYVEQQSGITVRRSEPSPSTAFVPSGSNDGAVITKPSGTEAFTSIYMNGQTHWEIEASLDDILFYRVATAAIGTASYTDTTAAAIGYSDNTLSDTIGDNTAPESVRHVAVDDDRLVLAGHRSTPALDSRLQWTPVEAAPGVGNDERIPTATSNFLGLDTLDGGGITALVAGESGNLYVFKLERTYTLARTGVLESAYRSQTESRSLGATKRGAVSGQDRAGTPCVYFTDFNHGLCRIGSAGIEQLGEDVKSTWEQVSAAMPNPTSYQPRLLYWPLKRQVWISVSSGDQVAGRFFLVFNAKFSSAEQQSYAVYTSATTAGGILEGVLFPDGGMPLLPHWAMVTPQVAKFTLTAVNDCGTSGRYRAYWVSKAYALGGWLRKFGIQAGVLVAQAASSTIGVGLIRNFGVERKDNTVSIAAVGSETHTICPLDNAFISECGAVQIELGDPSTHSGSQLDQTWVMDGYAARTRWEEETGG